MSFSQQKNVTVQNTLSKKTTLVKKKKKKAFI